jgi:hypothetical protein
MQVIVVPADDSQPCTAVAIPAGDWPAALGRLVARPAERAVYDRDAALWLDDGNGAATRPANRRATRYAFGHSEAGRQHRTDPDNPPYWLYGTVVITGADEPPGDVPIRLHAIFGVTGRSV